MAQRIHRKLRALLYPLIFTAFFSCQSLHHPGPSEFKIALFPFKNFSEERGTLMQIMPMVREELERKGIKVVDETSLNRFLLKKRIRSTAYVMEETAHGIREALGAKAILLGSVNAFFSKNNPEVGLSARLVDTSSGSILWANHASATGDDFTTLLDLGTIRSVNKLTSIVVNRLLGSFTISPQKLQKEAIVKVAVMPFKNRTGKRDAGMIVTYLFIVELFRSEGFDIVEYGGVRRFLVDLRIRHKGELDYQNIHSLGNALGVDGILVGTVERYTEGKGTSAPEVAIHARLLDTKRNSVVWSDEYVLSGDDSTIVFDWGKIRSADKVAHKVVSRLVEKMEKAKWHREESKGQRLD